MFKIYDGRSHFYQWDIDRKLIVEDASISEVHFCNQTDNYSLVCKTYIEDGLNLVNVPNILLQNDWRINVYAYDSNYTKFSEQFDVIRRCKPEDYVYTETEILNYNTLSDRITKIEEGGGITPTIGENGNWFLGNVDTNKPSRGEKGETGARGEKGADGATGATGADGKSAYSYAQEGGYTGTEEEFAAKLAAEKLPNPYTLTFTGAVSETYDGSSAKTIEIPSGGGSSGSYFGVYTVEEDVSQYKIPFEVSRYKRIVIGVNQASNPTSLTIGFVIDGLSGITAKEEGVSKRTCFMFDIIEWTPGTLANGGKYEIFGYSRRNNNPGANTLLNAVVQYSTTEENSLIVSGNDGVVISQGTIITITAIP